MALAAFACLLWAASSRAAVGEQRAGAGPRAGGIDAVRSSVLGSTRGGPPQPPNILLILTDDQRRNGTMGVMNDTRRLFAQGGIRYPNAFVTTPQCSPSRASIFSGQYTHNHGVRDNYSARDFNPDQTFQRYLKENGYRTALFGKYPFSREVGPLPHFDRSFVGFNERHQLHDPRQDSFIAAKASRFIRNGESTADRRPWLMVVAFHSPHGPLEPHPRYRHARVGRFSGNPATRETDFSDKAPQLADAQVPARTSRRWVRGQRRLLLSVDDGVERIFSELRRRGERDTLSIYSSDNGYYWGEHALTGKYLPYLDSARVPLYARWPGVLPAGAVDQRLAANIDIAPTILDATGLAAEHEIDGDSLLGPSSRDWLLLEAARRSQRPGVPAWERGYYDASTHYFRWAGGFEELYDLDEDPWELENVASERSAEVAAARAALEEAKDCAGASCP